jgi:proline iminopeptidase
MAFNGPELGEEAGRRVDEYAAEHAGDPLADQVVQDRIADWMTAMDLTLDPNRQPSLWDVRDRLGEITVPTLVLVGVADFICGEKWARQLHDGIPGSQLVVFGESGHFAHLEEPEAFFAAVLGFISAH